MATKNKLRDSVKTLIFGVLWIIGAGWYWYYLAGNPIDELALIRRAQVAQGFIIDSWEDVVDGDDGRPHWFALTYTYCLPNGRKFTKSTKSYSGRLKEELQELQKPYPIEVEYLTNNPTVSRIKGEGSDSFSDWLWRKVGLGILFLGLLVSPGVVMLRNAIRNIRKIIYSQSSKTQ